MSLQEAVGNFLHYVLVNPRSRFSLSGSPVVPLKLLKWTLDFVQLILALRESQLMLLAPFVAFSGVGDLPKSYLEEDTATKGSYHPYKSKKF